MKSGRVRKRVVRNNRRRIPSPRCRGTGMRSLDGSLGAMLRWSQRAHGLTARVRRAAVVFTQNMLSGAGRECAAVLQKHRPIIEELYVWKSGSPSQDPQSMKARLEEGTLLIESVFEILAAEFDITVIHNPGDIIPSPGRTARAYKFHERYRKDLPYSRVLSPGLRQGRTVISACEVVQEKEVRSEEAV